MTGLHTSYRCADISGGASCLNTWDSQRHVPSLDLQPMQADCRCKQYFCL